MTTIYVDSRKRVAGDDSSFEFDIGETIHLQTGAKLSVLKVRVADAFLSTDRGQYLYWIDQALGTLNWAILPVGAYTGTRLAAWISSNYAAATYVASSRRRDAKRTDLGGGGLGTGARGGSASTNTTWQPRSPNRLQTEQTLKKPETSHTQTDLPALLVKTLLRQHSEFPAAPPPAHPTHPPTPHRLESKKQLGAQSQ